MPHNAQTPPKIRKVITYGTFDLLHYGHIRLLERAKALGDYLIVGVTSDSFDKQRGKLNVVWNLEKRLNALRQTGLADEILVEEYFGQKVDDIQRLRPDVFVVGSDWRGHFDYLKDFCDVQYLERTKEISSTHLRNENLLLNLGILAQNPRLLRRILLELHFVSGLNPRAIYSTHVLHDVCYDFGVECCPTIESMLKDCDTFFVDSLYASYVPQLLQCGKHVLYTNPLCCSAKELARLFAMAHTNNCILLEANKTAYAPIFVRLLAMLKSNIIGRIYNVQACLTMLLPKQTIGDSSSFLRFGSVPMMAITKILGTQYQTLHFESFFEGNNDFFTQALFRYPHAIATATCGTGVKQEGNLVIAGERGYVLVSSPWWKASEFEICFEDRNQNQRIFLRFEGEGLRYAFAEFAELIRDHKESYKLTMKDSCFIAHVFERFREYCNTTKETDNAQLTTSRND